MNTAEKKMADNLLWNSTTALNLNTQTLTQLFEGQIPAIIIRSFLSSQSCDTITSNLKHLGMETYSHVCHPVGRLGLAQMEFHLKNQKSEYFNKTSEAREIYRQAIAGADDPMKKLIGYLQHSNSKSVELASESPDLPYFAGTFRNVMTVGHMHFDFAPFEATGWAISKIINQLSWNLYLNQPEGGDLRVYERFYLPSDESKRVPDGYWYEKEIVREYRSYTYSPKVGDLVMFNSRNFHEVEPVTGDRFSLSSFIGKTDEGKLLLWS